MVWPAPSPGTPLEAEGDLRSRGMTVLDRIRLMTCSVSRLIRAPRSGVYKDKEKEVLMRLLAGLAGVALVLAACGGAATAPSPSPAPRTASPSPAPTAAPTPTPTPSSVFKADLKSSNQNPPITGAEASCNGDATITITGVSVKFDVNIKGCPATTAINISHIHEGAAGTNGPVRVDTGIKAGDLTLTGGAVTYSRTVNGDAAIIAQILANPAGWYFNAHSTLNPGGVVRGQLVKSS